MLEIFMSDNIIKLRLLMPDPDQPSSSPFCNLQAINSSVMVHLL